MKEKYVKEFEYCCSVQDEYKKIIQPILDQFPFTHIWVGRFYHDGTFIDLGHDMNWKKALIESGYYEDGRGTFSVYANASNDRLSFTNWNYDDPLFSKNKKNSEAFGVTSLFNIYQVKDQYVENFGFGSDISYHDMVAFTRKNHDALVLICSYLQEKTEHLFTSEAAERATCEQPDSFQIETGPTLSKKLLPSQFRLANSYVTRRECVYVSLMAKGKKTKEVAQISGVSPHTVRSSLEDIKQRHGHITTLELLTTFLQNPVLAEINPYFLLNALGQPDLK